MQNMGLTVKRAHSQGDIDVMLDNCKQGLNVQTVIASLTLSQTQNH